LRFRSEARPKFGDQPRLAAITRGVEMVHQRVPQVYVEGRWERDESKEVEVASMGNPLEATGLLREGQAIELFNRRDYGAAALVFGDIASKVSASLRIAASGGPWCGWSTIWAAGSM
jgi:hypothetical protein